MATRAYLYDSQGTDCEVALSTELLAKLSEVQLLWVDLASFDEGEVRRLASLLDLPPEASSNLMRTERLPRLVNYGKWFQLNVDAVGKSDGGFEFLTLDFIVHENLVLTAHREPVALLGSFERRIRGDTQLGSLDAPAFVAALLDWHITGYFRIVEELEAEVDCLDEQALSACGDVTFLSKLAALRRQVARIRRALTPHREVYAALARPDFLVSGASDAGAPFAALLDRLERAVETTENARELLIGSFEIYATQTAQHTNDIMKTLTLVTVTLLPVAAVAGVLGMNFKAKLFDTGDLGFWIALSAMGLTALATLFVARRKRWI